MAGLLLRDGRGGDRDLDVYLDADVATGTRTGHTGTSVVTPLLMILAIDFDWLVVVVVPGGLLDGVALVGGRRAEGGSLGERRGRGWEDEEEVEEVELGGG